MPCAEPIKTWRPANGGPLSFQKHHPTNGRAYTPLDIPCGYCILCREEQARQWAVRIYHEASMHTDNAFITLTYADENIPPNGSLRYEDLAKFFKRLRKHLGPLRYYAVGEYGDKTLRPHYHACIFGQALADSRIMLRTKPTYLWTCPLLQRIWGLGMVSVGALNFQTARYTASYLTKKLRLKQKYVRVDEETGELIALEQPAARMSRNIAKDWWKKFNRHSIDHDIVVIDGHPQKPPRAYDRWLTEKDPEKAEEIKTRRKANAEHLSIEDARARAKSAHTRAQEKKKSKKI